MDAWQPIETAPRDGSAILACVADYENPAWNGLHPSRGPITVYWGTYHPNSQGDACWRDGSGHKRPYLTHWMPLPPQPKKG